MTSSNVADNPSWRNIEKDVKVFRWRGDLPDRIQAIIGIATETERIREK